MGRRRKAVAVKDLDGAVHLEEELDRGRHGGRVVEELDPGHCAEQRWPTAPRRD
jgi:hypothetical protein